MLADNLDVASQLADRISEVAPLPTTASVAQASEKAGLLQKIEDLSRQVAALTSGHTRHRHHSRNRRKAKDVPATRLRESRLLSILPAIRGQGEKVYTTVLLPPVGKGSNRQTPVPHHPAAYSSPTESATSDSWSTPVLISACFTEGSSQGAGSAPAMISSQPTVYPSRPMDGTPSRSTSGFDGTSPGISWWPTSKSQSSGWTC